MRARVDTATRLPRTSPELDAPEAPEEQDRHVPVRVPASDGTGFVGEN